MDRAHFPARVERVPQDVINWDGEILDNSWRNLCEILEKSWQISADFVTATRVRRGRGGKAKAKD